MSGINNGLLLCNVTPTKWTYTGIAKLLPIFCLPYQKCGPWFSQIHSDDGPIYIPSTVILYDF